MPRVVLPEIHREVWADPATFAEANAISVEDAWYMLSEATWLLSTLTDGRVHGGGWWEDRIRITPGTCDVALAHGPVIAVSQVVRTHHCGCDQEVLDDFCIIDDRTLRFCCGGPCQGLFRGCCDDWNVIVRYQQAPCLPPGSQAAVIALANEYVNAVTGKPCKLPERINNVTRQGVSWTIMDPQTFLKEGFTGIGVIDHWLQAAKLACPDQLRITDVLKGVVISSTPLDVEPAPFLGTAFSFGFDVPDDHQPDTEPC
jgi:hypothetical protein